MTVKEWLDTPINVSLKRPKVFEKVGKAIKAMWRPQSISDLDHDMDQLLMGRPSLAGVTVDEESAMTIPAFYNGVMQIANTVGSLKLPLFIKTGELSRRRYTESKLYSILMYKANQEMTSFNFRRTMQYHALVYGNGYAYKILDTSWRLVGLQLLNPTCMTPKRNKDTHEIEYVFKEPRTGEETIYPASSIFHIPGLGFDGIKGYGIVELAYNSLGLGMAMEDFLARFFGQGTHLGGVVSFPANVETMSDPTYQTFKKNFENKYATLNNTHKVLILQGGAEFQPLGMKLVDAQLLQARIFSIEDIARWLNMPPHKLKDLEHATYDNITSEQMSFLVDTIRPWLVLWETEISRQLINPGAVKYVYAEHQTEDLLRLDFKGRMEGYEIATRNGWMNRNEVRAKENMNPMGRAGDIYTVQGQMVDLGHINDKPPEPEPKEENEPPE